MPVGKWANVREKDAVFNIFRKGEAMGKVEANRGTPKQRRTKTEEFGHPNLAAASEKQRKEDFLVKKTREQFF